MNKNSLSDADLVASLLDDPFAKAAAQSREVVNGRFPTAPRSIIRQSWPYHVAKPENAQPAQFRRGIPW